MSYGISAKVDIFVNHVGKAQIDDEIESCNEIISMHEKELMIMAAMNPIDVVTQEDVKDGSVAEALRLKIDNLLESYRDEVIKLYRLELLKDNIKKVVEG